MLHPFTKAVVHKLCGTDREARLNPLELQLSGHFTLLKTWDLNGCPLLCMFCADKISGHFVWSCKIYWYVRYLIALQAENISDKPQFPSFMLLLYVS
jgi:hypothetical protein